MDNEDLFGDFASKSEDAKLEAFEGSTLALVLRQLGSPPAAVKHVQHRLGEGFTFDWFNEQAFIFAEVDSTRMFKFNFADLFFKPRSSELVKAWLDHPKRRVPKFSLVFRVFSYGRVVFSNYWRTDLDIELRLNLGDAHSLYISPFSGFFEGLRDSPPDLGS